ncbi:hypothetical protein NCG97_21905 [Streptomyces lydicamycinicus]|uniref:Uncharacterized protein n=1 Tax=Streptomyces lydicamycinicus TaxID=1546107 RepID=A0A0P4R8C9_9ACTN|nr:hypothetical protein [Streptomyces lydicamycinicus]USA02721.1 hypothetical protein NCG97_21905 [Streptomyces lydicamycinicus]GAO09565.1 hypothetical protein TPA0598_05_02860 [Streptomyces lydicamycinicus]
MRAQRRSVIRTATVATGALAVLLLPTGAAFAAEPGVSSESRTSIMLPDDGLVGLAEKAGHLPKAGLIGGAGVLGVAATALTVHRRRHGSRSQQA